VNERTIDRLDPVLVHHEGGDAAAGLAPGPAGAVPTEAFEEEYRKVGWWKGPDATPEEKARRREFWRSSGMEGVGWLVRHLRQERHIDVLHGAASLLADLGEMILGPVLEEVARGGPRDQALCLLWALVSLSESTPTLRIDAGSSEPILADRLRDDDRDLREAAAEALRLLGPERAIRWLEQGLRDETDDDVRRTIERELTRHRAGRS
jgi:hypothetical protein